MAVNDKVDASPTKDFFITMLTKDIDLIASIIDLVDNCVDGAIRISPNRTFNDLWVRLEMTSDHFRIIDNCGGINIETARQYAFRFGRPEGMESTPHSIGHFGVGMKRALFKLGSNFTVKSTTDESTFEVNVDVKEWKKSDNDWDFNFSDFDDTVPLKEQGTRIEVDNLHASVSDNFAENNFILKLREEIRQRHEKALNDGLSITINAYPIEALPLELLHSHDLKPAFYEKKYTINESSVVVKIFAGVHDSEPSEAGWYIYCNGRMIIGSDKTNITGWGGDSDTTIPKIHNQFARFRGFVYFDSDDATLLPWNTTKTGVDSDSPIYRSTRMRMIKMMRPVINFLNALEREVREGDDHNPLKNAIDKSKSVPVSKVRTSKTFTSPKKVKKPPVPRSGRIAYNRPKEQIDKIKKVLEVTRNRDVGERTFEYFFKRECNE